MPVHCVVWCYNLFTNSSPCLSAGSCKELDEETEICLCLCRWMVCMCVWWRVCVCPTWWIAFLFTCSWNKATAEFKLLLDILLISHTGPFFRLCVCELIHIAVVVQCCCMVVVNYRFLLCSSQCCVCFPFAVVSRRPRSSSIQTTVLQMSLLNCRQSMWRADRIPSPVLPHTTSRPSLRNINDQM